MCFHLGEGGGGRGLDLSTHYLKNQLNCCNMKFWRLYSCFLKSVVPLKYYLADDIVPNGHLLVSKNYPKRKKLKKLPDGVLICSR